MSKKGLFMGYDTQFKEEAVHQLLTSGKSREQLASELGVSVWSLSQWKQAALRASGSIPTTEAKEAHSSGTVKPAKGRPAADIEAENLMLRRELEAVRRQRDLLKKAIAICSQDELNDEQPSRGQQPDVQQVRVRQLEQPKAKRRSPVTGSRQ